MPEQPGEYAPVTHQVTVRHMNGAVLQLPCVDEESAQITASAYANRDGVVQVVTVELDFCQPADDGISLFDITRLSREARDCVLGITGMSA